MWPSIISFVIAYVIAGVVPLTSYSPAAVMRQKTSPLIDEPRSTLRLWDNVAEVDSHADLPSCRDDDGLSEPGGRRDDTAYSRLQPREERICRSSLDVLMLILKSDRVVKVHKHEPHCTIHSERVKRTSSPYSYGEGHSQKCKGVVSRKYGTVAIYYSFCLSFRVAYRVPHQGSIGPVCLFTEVYL